MKFLDYQLFLSLKEQLDSEIEDIKTKLGIHDCCFPTEYTQTGINLSGVEYWSYGGRESHSGYIDTNYLLDETKEEAFQVLEEEKQAAIKLKEQKEAESRLSAYRKKLNEEREMYEKLKLKFET